MQAAQARNRREAITGVLFYGDSHFFQWLEGPADGVGRVMRSIRRDPRHTDVEVLEDGPASGRSFGDWDMRLATRETGSALWHGEVIEPSPEIIDPLPVERRGGSSGAASSSLVAPATDHSSRLLAIKP